MSPDSSPRADAVAGSGSADPLDPYRDWLNLDSFDRPLDHYQLLALPAYESDAARIEHHAMMQMAKLLRHEGGPHAGLARDLIQELDAATRCLTDLVAKAAYDEQLRSASGDDLSAYLSLERADRHVTDGTAHGMETPSADQGCRESSELDHGPSVQRNCCPAAAEAAHDAGHSASRTRHGSRGKPSSPTRPQRSRLKSGQIPRHFWQFCIATGLLLAALYVGIPALQGMSWGTDPADAFVAQLSDPDAAVRASAAANLRDVGPNSKAVPLLIKLIQEDPDTSVRAASAAALTRSGEGIVQSAAELKPLLAVEKDPAVKASLDWIVQAADRVRNH